MTTHQTVLLNPRDNCAVAIERLIAGSTVTVHPQLQLTIRQEILAGHKVALQHIAVDQPVLKYGWPIGIATQKIEPGQHIHTHNLRCDHKVDLEALATSIPPTPEPILDRWFLGYVRPDGRIGTRNYIAVISTVNCSASVSKYVAQRFTPELLRDYPNVDGVVAFRHEGGCAMALDGLKHQMLDRVLGGIAKHPNIGGFVLIGLGCEQATIGHLMKSQGLVQIARPGQSSIDFQSELPAISIQDEGGTRKTIERGVEMVAKMLPRVNGVRREKVAASHLILGTNCGGSDGYSGITANPAVGIAADRIVACGGTAILTETPELYGAEQTLTRTARTREVAQKLLDRIEWWKWYTGLFGEVLDMNPSTGNKAGGLTTIVEKSLGAAAKGGSTALEGVYEYAEPIRTKGLVVMDSPGFDPASVTGLVASGANLIVFTTGRGSCFGCKPVPSLKIASNSALFRRMPEDMDLNAGTVVEGESVESAGERIFEQLLKVASGEKTKSELLGIGDEEFSPWTVGPTL